MNEEKLNQIRLLAQEVGLSVKEVEEYLTPLYKRDRLEKIYSLSREAGLSLKEVLDYLTATEEVALLDTDKEIFPGMFVYEDNKFSKTLIPHSQVKAVVAFVANGMVYAICLKEERLPWSSTDLEVKATQQVTDGREATKEILEAAQKNKGKAEAAQWCYDYNYDGVKQGEAFLPSVEELDNCSLHLAEIDAAFEMLGEESPHHNQLWTSNEEDYEEHAWRYILSSPDGRMNNNSCYKTKFNAVRAMLAIKI